MRYLANKLNSKSFWYLIILTVAGYQISCAAHLKHDKFSQLLPKSFKEKSILFTGQQQYHPRLYLLHNISRQTFYFDHNAHHPMSAGWASRSQPNRWSAILINKPHFTLNCLQLLAPGRRLLDCAKLTDVYQIKQLTWPSHHLGTYWVTENQPLSKFYLAIKKRGFTVKSAN